MACRKCDFKGYIETFLLVGGRELPTVNQCFICRDIENYSKEVKKRLDELKRQRALQEKQAQVACYPGTDKPASILEKIEMEIARKKAIPPCPVIPITRSKKES